jgi:hypothetical protein
MIPFQLRPRLAAVLLAVVVGAVVVPVATAHGPNPVLSGGLFAQNQSLEFRWRGGSEPPTAIRTAIRAAADDIGATRKSKAATFVYDTAGANPIGYGPGATCGVNGLACFTRSAPSGFTMWLREQGHVFDWGTLRWCQMYTTAPNGCYDAETITLDEFGHVEILNHHVNYSDDRDYEDAVVQTFSRTKPSAGWNMHVLGRCDVATLQREYDVISWSTDYSTCLDIDTALTLSASPTSIAADATTTLSAVLKVVDRDAYDRLGGNPVSSRVVKLQRRSVGATTWVAVGTMSAGASGTYSLAVRLARSLEFRAIFSTPSDEGLNGDTSPTVTVNVSGCTDPCPLSAGQ